jgi:hypothetical protein
MLRPNLFAAAALATALVLTACDRSGPTAALDTDGILASVTSGPGIPGESHLMRIGAQEWTISTADPYNEVFTIYADPAEQFFCGGPGGPEFSVQLNEILTNMGRMVNDVAQGSDLELYVYDFFDEADLMGRTLCEYFEQEWKYRGTVNYTEVYHRNRIENNTAWHWTSNGTVYDRDGAPYSFSELQVVVRAADGSSANWIKENISVTPLGGN